ncbi:MAG: response regulator [Bacteroidetes bacterium]|nr:response regulator [Bacteroidota bacterium]MBL6944377.1 response regulator [Bacteroidales bacterium]
MNSNLPNRPILIVEDNPMDLDMTLEGFKEIQLDNIFDICRDGEEAIVYIENHRDNSMLNFPCLVLLDLKLPKVDGLDVLKYIRDDEVWKKIPVIILTTSSGDEDIDRAYKIGANSYLIKPVDSRAFIEVANNIKSFWLTTNKSPFK